MLIGIVAIHGIGNDLKTGDLRGLALPTYKTTTPIVKHVTDDSGASTAILTTKAEIKEAVSSLCAEYGLNCEQFYNTVQGESSFNPDPPGNVLSRGVAQFTLDTWIGNCSKTDERLNPYRSLACMAHMWSKGQQYRWDAYCFRYYDQKCIDLRGLYPKNDLWKTRVWTKVLDMIK